MNLVLIGYMGSGKTAVGNALASTLKFPFVDLDNLIEEAEGKSISEIFATRGEIYFRKKETEMIGQVLNDNQQMILSTGGGTPCYGNTMDTLLGNENVITIYLKSSVENLAGRLFTERKTRPLIAHLDSREDLVDFIRKHLFERAPVYERSSVIVTVEDKGIGEIVEEIVLQLF